ncbi:MAG: acyl-CoA dehydrogenase family protein, partial [Haloarculaceae archaeon]
MVDFSLTAEQRAVRDTVREFAREEVEPVAREHEESGEWPEEVWEQAVEADLVGLGIPEEFGGAGMGQVEAAIFADEVAYADAGILAAIGTSFGTRMVAEYGTHEQKGWILEGVASGDLIGALGNTEPEHGSDAASIETTAEQDGDEYVIDGVKTFITHGSIADYVLTMCRTGGAGHGG